MQDLPQPTPLLPAWIQRYLRIVHGIEPEEGRTISRHLSREQIEGMAIAVWKCCASIEAVEFLGAGDEKDEVKM